MVERTESSGFDEFDGEVVSVQLEDSKKEGITRKQWHIEMKALDKEIKGKSGHMHEWVGLSDTATESSVARDSVADKYIIALEDIHGKAVKGLKTVADVFKFMKGKKYHFKKKVLGRAFKNNPASEYWVPVKEL